MEYHPYEIRDAPRSQYDKNKASLGITEPRSGRWWTDSIRESLTGPSAKLGRFTLKWFIRVGKLATYWQETRYSGRIERQPLNIHPSPHKAALVTSAAAPTEGFPGTEGENKWLIVNFIHSTECKMWDKNASITALHSRSSCELWSR